MGNRIIEPGQTFSEQGVVPAQGYWPPLPGVPPIDEVASGVVWKPGVPSSGNVVATWEEVQNAIAAVSGALNVFVNSSVAPAIVGQGITNCFGRVTFRAGASEYTTVPSSLMTLPDGAILLDPGQLAFGVSVILQGTAQPNLQFSNIRQFAVVAGSSLENQGTQPAVRVSPGSAFILALVLGSTFTPNPSAAIELTDPSSTGIIASFTGGKFTGNNVVVGPVGSTLIIAYDAGVDALPTNPGFLGTVVPNEVDSASFMKYSPSNLANWSGTAPSSVADALDRIAAHVGPIP
jgi:hypothetical protein